jgi:hypothetical protein
MVLQVQVGHMSVTAAQVVLEKILGALGQLLLQLVQVVITQAVVVVVQVLPQVQVA